MMKMNDLLALNEKLFKAMDRIQDESLTGAALQEQISRQLAFNELAKTTVAQYALMGKTMDVMETLDYEVAVEELPLLPTRKRGSERKQIADSQVIQFNEELSYKPPKKRAQI